MENINNQKKFSIKYIIEQKPLEEKTTQNVFDEWCRINDSIIPIVVDRQQWEKINKKDIFKKLPNGKIILTIPEDLHLWEMVGIMEIVDHETFKNKPEKQKEAKERIENLGKLFCQIGIYIAKRINKINKGKKIAAALAEELYQYGQSLIKGKQSQETVEIQDLASLPLTSEETKAIDRFLAGDSLHTRRYKKLIAKQRINFSKTNDEIEEEERQRTLAQFFRVAEKAFLLKNKSDKGELYRGDHSLAPWEDYTPIHNAFIQKVEQALRQKIEIPQEEFEMSILRRAFENIANEISKNPSRLTIIINKFLAKIGFKLIQGKQKLKDLLNIEQLKKELKTAYQSEDLKRISEKEIEIASKIQRAVSKFPYKISGHNPAQILIERYINCVGATILGGIFMKEVGLNYLVGGLPMHSIIILVTADGRLFLYDMQLTSAYEIKNKNLLPIKQEKITVQNIVDFAQDPDNIYDNLLINIITPHGIQIDEDSKDSQNKPVMLSLYKPEYGQRMQILFNTADAFIESGRLNEAAKIYEQLIAADTKYPYTYLGLGNIYAHKNNYNKAIKMYRKALAINPNFDTAYYYLGNVLFKISNYKDAVQAYQRAVALNNNFYLAYCRLGIALLKLKRYENAIFALRRAINIKENDCLPFYYLSVALVKLERYKEAIDVCKKAIHINPKFYYSYFQLGYVLYKIKNYKEALEALNNFLQYADKTKDSTLINNANMIIKQIENLKNNQS
ncbi:MAG: hypothetical protein KatS3mg097_119 [Candidatus Parcubacteria bacterium]|nr:MAG: hypothetical protein KatS3mg097_119 [Candidatus Parcubacteria bacterium]